MFRFFKKLFPHSQSTHPSSHSCYSVLITAECYQNLQRIAEIKGCSPLDASKVNSLITEAIAHYLEFSHSNNSAPSKQKPNSTKYTLDYPWCAADDYLVWKSTETKTESPRKS